ncbi:MAG: cytidine deaminase [Erysipelotrichaceae bacterium]|nr:cytidine deaminase [Erysipelotrichaceae bacterium]
MTNSELIEMAIKAREMAYAPYSNWYVGAALLTKSGKVYLGCNIENGGFSSTVCAERCAFFKAVSEGERDFEMIAIVGGDKEKGMLDYCTPCGVCRTVMAEFASPDDFRVLCAKSPDEYMDLSLRELIPYTHFAADNEGYGFTPKR